MTLSRRMSRIAPSPTLRVTAEADRLRRQGIDVVDLGAGEPDFPTPEHIKAAAQKAIADNFTKYTPSAGIMELRQAICDRYRADYGVEYTPDETIVTAGGKQALYNVAMALVEEGDEVITHGPFWPSIPEQVKLAGATPVIVHTHAEDGFAVRAEPILAAITARTKAIVLNSPCNPTGALIAEEELAAIADAARKRGLWVIADLTYEKLVYEVVPHNLPRVLSEHLRDRAVLCSAASKAYAMTGWRAGWAIGPAKLIAACNAVQGHSTSNVASITQKAALAALTGPQESVTAMLDEYRERRDKVFAWMTADPLFTCIKPRGAFYLFPYAADALEPAGVRTTSEFAEQLLEHAHVALTAGEEACDGRRLDPLRQRHRCSAFGAPNGVLPRKHERTKTGNFRTVLSRRRSRRVCNFGRLLSFAFRAFVLSSFRGYAFWSPRRCPWSPVLLLLVRECGAWLLVGKSLRA